MRKAVVAALSGVALGPFAVLGANLVVGQASPPPLEVRPASPAISRGALEQAVAGAGARAKPDAREVDPPQAFGAESGPGAFSENESYYREILASQGFSSETKVDLLEALGDASPEAAQLLLEVAAGAEDPELRAAAVESLAWLEGPDDAFTGPAVPPGVLLDLLETESSAGVRAELYSALAFDAGETYAEARLDPLVERVLSEQQAEARLQGSRLVASLLRLHPDPRLAEIFDRDLVPFLRAEALQEGSRYARLVSVDALKLAGTLAASEALRDLSRSQDPSVARAADHALFAQARLRNSGGSLR